MNCGCYLSIALHEDSRRLLLKADKILADLRGRAGGSPVHGDRVRILPSPGSHAVEGGGVLP